MCEFQSISFINYEWNRNSVFISIYFTRSADQGETFSIIPFPFKLQCEQLLRTIAPGSESDDRREAANPPLVSLGTKICKICKADGKTSQSRNGSERATNAHFQCCSNFVLLGFVCLFVCLGGFGRVFL